MSLLDKAVSEKVKGSALASAGKDINTKAPPPSGGPSIAGTGKGSGSLPVPFRR